MKNKLTAARERINEIDREMARLFVERLKASELVAEYKQEHGLEILDPIREADVIRRNSEGVENDVYREYYAELSGCSCEKSSVPPDFIKRYISEKSLAISST